MRIYSHFLILFLIVIVGCSSPEPLIEITLKNNLDIPRNAETIEIKMAELQPLLEKFSLNQIVVRPAESQTPILTQLLDQNGDGNMDVLLFQQDFKAGESKQIVIEGSTEPVSAPASAISTFARFVPERIDDFAWENDKVAFRTYGPTAQQITESGKPGGTLSSGIDCWLKKVDYPVIDKWYKDDLEQGKSYHEDHGEGLDNYHVGPSRGTGGIGIWKDGKLATSKNYQSWKTIANGPIRTVFELDYGTWDADGLNVRETKRIQIDLGSNLFKTTLILPNYAELPNVAVGITLHEKLGEVKSDQSKGWMRYWEPHEGSELSTAVVVSPSSVMEIIDHRVDEVDQSNLLAICKPQEELTYYAGFAWKESGQFALPDEFDQYLEHYALRIASPIDLDINVSQ